MKFPIVLAVCARAEDALNLLQASVQKHVHTHDLATNFSDESDATNPYLPRLPDRQCPPGWEARHGMRGNPGQDWRNCPGTKVRNWCQMDKDKAYLFCEREPRCCSVREIATRDCSRDRFGGCNPSPQLCPVNLVPSRGYQQWTTCIKPPPTTTTTTICVPGSTDKSVPCRPKTCAGNGKAWTTAVVNCAPCNGGNPTPPKAGECCGGCVLTTKTTTPKMFEPCHIEGKRGSNDCPAGCGHVENCAQCKLAARVWKKKYDTKPWPRGSPRPTGCFRNKKFKIKCNDKGPFGGYKGKWPICMKL